MSNRARWTLSIGLVITGVVVGLGMVIVARVADAPTWPWMYLGLVIAIVSAVAAMLLAIMRANEVSE